MMLSIIISESSCNIKSFSLVCLNNEALLSSNKIVERTSFSQVLEWSSTENLLFHFTLIIWNLVSYLISLFWKTISVETVPPNDAPITSKRHAFITCLTSLNPANSINWIVMRLFKDSGEYRPNDSLGVAITSIEKWQRSVVRSTNNNISIFVVERHTAKRWWSQKCFFWEVWIV